MDWENYWFELGKVGILLAWGGYFTFSRGRVPLTRHMLPFEISLSPSTLSDQLYNNKNHLKSIILEMHSSGMSYRQIGSALGIHWTRVGQIIKTLINPWVKIYLRLTVSDQYILWYLWASGPNAKSVSRGCQRPTTSSTPIPDKLKSNPFNRDWIIRITNHTQNVKIQLRPLKHPRLSIHKVCSVG